MKIGYKGVKEEGTYRIKKITVCKDVITVHLVPVVEIYKQTIINQDEHDDFDEPDI